MNLNEIEIIKEIWTLIKSNDLGYSVHFLEALRSSLELLQDVLIKTDENFKIEFAEGGIRPLLGVEPKQLVGKMLNEIFTDENFLEKYKDF